MASQLSIGLTLPPAGTWSAIADGGRFGRDVQHCAGIGGRGRTACPRRAGEIHPAYFYPDRLAVWLQGQRSPVRRSLGKTLAKHLEQQREAA
ncbi:hypothetical protein [Deinococcus hopiensis]|uniref:hypothetical protein n=1 Tax=Deinococcus hopiensis TaxID=309885 RepID=UPI0009FD8E3D|nr:hypothetical protein [Deinococcus hopiensis]